MEGREEGANAGLTASGLVFFSGVIMQLGFGIFWGSYLRLANV